MMDGDIWVPNTAVVSPPMAVCRCCGETFDPEHPDRFAAHVDKCYEKNEAEIRMQSPREHAPGIFGPGVGDDEQANWIKRNKHAILAGKVKM